MAPPRPREGDALDDPLVPRHPRAAGLSRSRCCPRAHTARGLIERCRCARVTAAAARAAHLEYGPPRADEGDVCRGSRFPQPASAGRSRCGASRPAHHLSEHFDRTKAVRVERSGGQDPSLTSEATASPRGSCPQRASPSVGARPSECRNRRARKRWARNRPSRRRAGRAHEANVPPREPWAHRRSEARPSARDRIRSR